MANRPTIQDVAREAGVSVATVDRALNGRAPVRDETMRKIGDAAHRLGYHGRSLISQRLNAQVPKMRLGFVLLKEKQEFYQNLHRIITEGVANRQDIRGEAVIRYVTSQAPGDFKQAFEEIGTHVDAVAAIAVNHQSLDSVVQRLKDRDVPVFSLLNDFAQGIRRCYIGLNNIKVGRQAAWLIARTAREPGKLALFVGGNRWHGHDLREVGFRSYIREQAPGFTVLDTLVNLESRQLTYEATLDLLHRHPDLRGFYVAGGGMEGAIAALREMRAPEEVSLVVNEVTSESRAGLLDGYVTMVITTPLEEIIAHLIDLMIHARDMPEDNIGQKFHSAGIILPEFS